jgi:site-specific recombinase XerD
MAQIGDISSTDIKLKAALKRLKESVILAGNKQLISNFYFSLRRENLKKNTQISHINTLRVTCELYEKIGIIKILPEITLHDFDTFLFYLEDDKKYKPGTINIFKKSFKKFMKWHYGEQVPQWIHREIKLVKCPEIIQPRDVPTREEFSAFLEAAKHPRDRAIIAVCADGGIRIGALLSCTVGSVADSEYGAIIYLSREGQNKTTQAKGIPLTWSSGYLQQWLAIHPLREDTNAPLWTTLKHRSGHVEALSYEGAYQMFLQIEKHLHGCKKHIYPHMMRHYAVTAWILDGLHEQAINHRAGWVRDSKQMMKVYGNFADADMNAHIFEHYGLKTENSREVNLKKCPRCNNVLKPGDRFCSQCSLVLDQAALQDMQTYEEDFRRAYDIFRKMKEEGL